MTELGERILASQRDRKPVALEVPEWGVTVWIKQMTVADQVTLSEDTSPADMPVRVLLYTLVDSEGARIFTEADKDALSQEAFPIVLRVFTEVAKLNGLSSDELEAAMQGFDQARAGSLDNGSRSPSGAPSRS